MTKAELIEKLKNVPDDADICVYDYYGSETYATEINIDFYGENKEFVDVFIS